MQTKNMIQTNVNVIRIVNLKVGDIYKRFDDSSSYSDNISFGIVKGIFNNGEKTFLETIEYKKSYSSMEASIKIWGGEKDIAIFPATIEDIQNEFDGFVEKTEKEVLDLQKQIANKKKIIEDSNFLLSGELQKTLQAPDFKEIPQKEYNQIKAEKESI
jgi:hypothetical protein